MQFFRLSNFFTSLFVCILGLHSNAQSQTFLNGFEHSIKGDEISYHGPDPRAEKALLVRSQDSTNVIQWGTASIPESYSQSTVSFVWLFGMDASSDQHNFILTANGNDIIHFKNPAIATKEKIQREGGNGSVLQLRITKIDRHKDVMGYAILTLPMEMITPGKPVALQVRGETAGSNIWYMTFKYPVGNEIDIQSQPLLVQENEKKMQALKVEIVNLDEQKKILIQSEGQSAIEDRIEPGYNAFQYYVPAVNNKKDIPVNIRIGMNEEITRSCSIKPVRPWTIYFVQHTHTDIGYTRPQSEILPEHLRFIDYALDYCDLTDHYPDDAKFRWTCESAWPVEQYLKRRPENQVERLLKRISEGRIEVSAMQFNMAEVADETALKELLKPIKLFHEKGINVTAAMQDDVNGIGWCMADYLPDVGVKYLIMGEHGHRALIPFDLPTSFWWQSPSGKKILAFRGEHYMHGNALLIHTGDLDNFQSNLLNYLENLEEKKYPFNHLSLQYSGYVTDNSPPALVPVQVIKEWNEKYIWPKLRSATASEFMHYIEKNHGDELDTFQKAWPDWWTDGFGSAARETAAIREAQSEMNITTGLLSMSSVLGSEINQRVHSTIDEIYKNILFYDEHTFGAAESISEPFSKNTMEQWAEKSSYAWEALKQSRILREEAFGLIQDHLPRHSTSTITIFNTLNWARSGPVQLYIDHEIIEPGSDFAILDPSGQPIPVQAISSRSDGTYWMLWVKDIPPMGYKSLVIEKGLHRIDAVHEQKFNGTMENEFWSVSVSAENGSISSLYNKAMKRDFIEPESHRRPGQLIYERLSNRHQLERFTLHEEPGRTSLTEIKFNEIEEGPLWTSLSFTGILDECALGPVNVEYRLYRSEPVIEFVYSLVKEPVRDPEALYVAFPLKVDDGEILFEAQGGLVRPGKDQLPGTSSDWNTVQHFVAVRSNESQIVFSSPEIPLFHLGGLNIGKFSYYHEPETNHIYSWVLNNYWTTNFRASQEGTLSWRYFMTATDDPGSRFATNFGWGSQVPLIGRVFPKGKISDKPESLSLLSSEIPDLLLVNATPSVNGQGIVLQLREVSGKSVEIYPKDLLNLDKAMEVFEVNAIGEPLKEIPGKFKFAPNSVHFIEIKWNQTK